MSNSKSVNNRMLFMLCIHLWLGFRFCLTTFQPAALFTDGIEKAEALNSNYISIFFVEEGALENVQGPKGVLSDYQPGWAFGDLPWDFNPWPCSTWHFPPPQGLEWRCRQNADNIRKDATL